MCTRQKVDGSRWLTHDGLPPEEGVVVLAVEEGDGDAQGAGRVPVGARPQEQRTEEDDAPDRVEEDGQRSNRMMKRPSRPLTAKEQALRKLEMLADIKAASAREAKAKDSVF